MEGGSEMVATLMLAAVLGADVPRVQIVVLSAPAWCRPCVAAESDFKPWLIKSGWRVGAEATDHVRVVDVDCDLEIAEQFKPKAFPCFVLMREGREVRRYIGYRGRRALVEDYMAEWRK